MIFGEKNMCTENEKLSLIISREDVFSSRYFDYQKSDKYIYYNKHNEQIEVGVYTHYLSATSTDIAIDLSTMIGCPMKCLFCQSASVNYERNLSSDEIAVIAKRIIKNHIHKNTKQITCSLQGIGEPSLIPETVIDLYQQLINYDKRVKYSISTIGASIDGLNKIINSGIKIDNLQITKCGTTNIVEKELTPNGISIAKLSELIKEIIKRHNIKKAKLNYILIKGKTDSKEDLQNLIAIFKNRGIAIKISYLNETECSTKYGLLPTSYNEAILFSSELQENGIDSYVFGSFKNIAISCGQLLTKK
ncbi:MAG: radical SAM protein [Chlorobium sp.]|nr:MAG: radical SAM protein [Chlorobium sp.]